mmetsp:Transcript_87823/g.151601  ORF Transcript_87823/g.151601 Transcript_87823/m.151601 type:complete len:731 (-) Transcript_87823:298-2490(-)
MAIGPAEVETGTSETQRKCESFQKKHDDWTLKIEEAMRTLKATQDTLKATMNKIDHVTDMNRDASTCLAQTRQSLDGRLSAAKVALDIATEQMALSMGDPGAKQMLLERSMWSHGGGNSTVRPGGNSTAAAGGLELEDLARCGRGLSQLGAVGGFGGSAGDEDADLQRALAESMQMASVPISPPAAPGGTEDEDEELRRAIAASLEPAAPSPSRAVASRPQTPVDPLRAQIADRLRSKPFMEPDDQLFMHGRAYKGPLDAPTKIWESKEAPREDHGRPDWLTASEFEDSPEVARAKVRQLAELMRLSKKTVLYTGAGISASVIGQAALSGENKVGWKPNPREAKPTPTHIALGLLGKEGMIHSWVQQNHDGLPQKAGFPQEGINEIHGSWFDPSNPVVKYSGSLHNRAHPWMVNDAETADLVIVLGTSLSGLNADQVACKTARRSLLPTPPARGRLAAGARVKVKPPGYHLMYEGVVAAVLDDGDLFVELDDFQSAVVIPRGADVELLRPALGTVCINLQQTPRDGEMSLRLFGRSDVLLQMLLKELGFGTQRLEPPSWPKESRVLVPYDKDGNRLVDPKAKKMWLDLRDGQEVRITPGHNIQGAKQPMYMHIGASEPVTFKGETRQPAIGLGRVLERQEESTSFTLQIEGVQMRLGIWWLDTAMRGAIDVLPVVNQNPELEDAASAAHPEEYKDAAPAAKSFARPSIRGPPRKRPSTPPASAETAANSS